MTSPLPVYSLRRRVGGGVCVCLRERETVRVCERECVCVCVRESVFVSVCLRDEKEEGCQDMTGGFAIVGVRGCVYRCADNTGTA